MKYIINQRTKPTSPSSSSLSPLSSHSKNMDSHTRSSNFKVNMFQCIVVIDSIKPLKMIANELRTLGDYNFKLFSPGSLGKIVHDPEQYQIGSISIKRNIEGKNLSILLFSTHKIKISGGITFHNEDIPNTDKITNYITNHFIKPIVEVLYEKDKEFQVVKHMFNAILYRERSIGKKRFIGFIEHLKTIFDTKDIIMPDIMRVNGNQRGRICAIKVKQPDGRGVFAVDHSGNVQFFSYSSIEDLQKHKCELMKVWSL